MSNSKCTQNVHGAIYRMSFGSFIPEFVRIGDNSVLSLRAARGMHRPPPLWSNAPESAGFHAGSADGVGIVAA